MTALFMLLWTCSRVLLLK